MSGAILKATNSSFQECMTFCRSIYMKKVIELHAFIFEQPSYINPTEHKISTAYKKTKVSTNEEVSCFKSLGGCIYHANKC